MDLYYVAYRLLSVEENNDNDGGNGSRSPVGSSWGNVVDNLGQREALKEPGILPILKI